MTTAVEQRLQRAAHPLVVALLAAQALRIAAAVGSALADIARNESGLPGAGSRTNLGVHLSDFGEAGGETGALILLLAAAVLWLTAGGIGADGGRALPRWRRDVLLSVWLLALTALSALVLLAGALILLPDQDFFPAAHVIYVVGVAGSSLVMCAAGYSVVRRLDHAVEDATVAGDDDTGAAAVFAVDRSTGDVLAWRTLGDALDNAPVYGVEDDEYEFLRDDGTVLRAGLSDDGRVELVATDVDRFDHLVAMLQRYAERRALQVPTADRDEPLAYVDPISRDRWLEMWPGWLRWAGRLARPPRA